MNETKKYKIYINARFAVRFSGQQGDLNILFDFLAEREGFEPSVLL